jgi:hypothetical protein
MTGEVAGGVAGEGVWAGVWLGVWTGECAGGWEGVWAGVWRGAVEGLKGGEVAEGLLKGGAVWLSVLLGAFLEAVGGGAEGGEAPAAGENLLEGDFEGGVKRGALGGEMERAGVLTGANFDGETTFRFGFAWNNELNSSATSNVYKSLKHETPSPPPNAMRVFPTSVVVCAQVPGAFPAHHHCHVRVSSAYMSVKTRPSPPPHSSM